MCNELSFLCDFMANSNSYRWITFIRDINQCQHLLSVLFPVRQTSISHDAYNECTHVNYIYMLK